MTVDRLLGRPARVIGICLALVGPLLVGPLLGGVASEVEQDGAKKKAEAKKKAPKKVPDGRRSGSSKKAPVRKPPRPASLPSQGVYKAADLARLAGEMRDCTVQIGDTGVEEIRIEVIPLLAGQSVTLEELKLLLAFHRVYLFDSTDVDEGDVIVASTDPAWRPYRARYSQVLQVSALRFKQVWAELEAAIEKYNASRPAGEAKVVGVPVEAVGKIFLRTPNKRTLNKLTKLVRGEVEPPPDRLKLFAYVGRFRSVHALRDMTLEKLSAGERVKARFVVMRRGNRLLYRAPAELGERIRELLQRADRR